jgi:signal transduction histidine kinase
MDLTERIQAEKEIARLASFPTLNPNPVFEVDFEGNITYANPATESLFPDLEESGLSHPFLSNWPEVVAELKNKTKTTAGREVKVAEHWYLEQFFLVPETQQIRIYTTDIDELKLTEEARIKVQEKLEENAIMLEEYASQMEQLAAQRAEQLKNAERMAAIGQTAGMVGHDIRNPLQAITSDMYIITEEIKSIVDGEGKRAILESIDLITENLTYINKIVSDLQDYTRPLKPSIQEVNLSELMESTLLSINVPNRISITTKVAENSYTIKTDIAYLRRILTNLATNAVQALPNEGKLTINAHRKKDKTVISVQDTGVGIPEHVKIKMFTPLFTTKSKGQGLGLAVVKRLVEALNGTVTFESVENQGTKFTLELSQPE